MKFFILTNALTLIITCSTNCLADDSKTADSAEKDKVAQLIQVRNLDRSYERYLKRDDGGNFASWEYDRRKRRQTAGIVLAATGGVLVLGGLVGAIVGAGVEPYCDSAAPNDCDGVLPIYSVGSGLIAAGGLVILIPGWVVIEQTKKKMDLLKPHIGDRQRSKVSLQNVSFGPAGHSGVQASVGFSF